jgi:pyruvate/2-oxoglutarate dehydrogenase complex dihydrolipoamide dehydrogenase (E3) component
VNERCVPTKVLIRSAEVMHLVARRAAEFGVEVDGKVRFNLAQAVARKDNIVLGWSLPKCTAALERR